MKNLKVIVFGKPPPPIGGVTIFIKNLIDASRAEKTVELTLFKYKQISFRRYDASHINASNPIKRFILLIIGLIISRRVYFTIHGGRFNEKNLFNRMSIKLSSGVYCLNTRIKLKLDALRISNFVHTTIFNENQSIQKKEPLKNRGPKKILIYINNNKHINGEEIYGASFFAAAIKKIVHKTDFETIVVDLSKHYKEIFTSIPRTTYHDSPVDFKELLSRCDIYVRPTSTDGMSVALLEAGIIGIHCLASDVIDRPSFAKTYQHGSEPDFLAKLQSILDDPTNSSHSLKLTSIKDFYDFMRNPPKA